MAKELGEVYTFRAIENVLITARMSFGEVQDTLSLEDFFRKLNLISVSRINSICKFKRLEKTQGEFVFKNCRIGNN